MGVRRNEMRMWPGIEEFTSDQDEGTDDETSEEETYTSLDITSNESIHGPSP